MSNNISESVPHRSSWSTRLTLRREAEGQEGDDPRRHVASSNAIVALLGSEDLRQAWESRSTLRLNEAFDSLPSLARENLQRRWSEETLRQIFSISQEDNRDFLMESIFHLATELEDEDRLELAVALYRGILSNDPSLPPLGEELKLRTQTQLNAILGIGNSGARAEFCLRRLAAQSTDPANLAGIVIAGGLGNWTRFGISSRLALSASENILTRGLGARLIANSLAFLVEAPAFTATLRSSNALLGRPQDWSAAAIGRDLISAALTLFSLKSSGALFGYLGQGIPNPLVQKLIPQLGMLGGIQLASRLEQALSLKPQQDHATTFIDSLALLVNFNVGGHLAEGLVGAPAPQELQGIEARLQSRNAAILSSVPATQKVANPSLIPSINAFSLNIDTVATRPARLWGLPIDGVDLNFALLRDARQKTSPEFQSEPATLFASSPPKTTAASQEKIAPWRLSESESGETSSSAARAKPSITIVGGGASGTLVAKNLLEQARRPLHIQIVEGAEREPGLGVAYSTPHEHHLLNVPVEKLGALPDDLGHFMHWAQERDPAVQAGQFLPRKLYGEYLQDVLAKAEAGKIPEVLFTRVRGRVSGFEVRGKNKILQLEDGRELASDQVVLALGNARSANIPLENTEFFSSPHYTQDPFLRGGAAYLNVEGPVLLIGTGLTMVDVAISLLTKGKATNLLAVSRHGQLPQVHRPAPAYAAAEAIRANYLNKTLPQLLRTLRQEIRLANASGSNWRAAIDALRPITNELWSGLSERERGQFLRHLQRLWDIHRHRIPSASANTVADLQSSGRLQIQAGRIQAIQAQEHGALVTVRPRGAKESIELQVAHVVNCTGPDGNYWRLQESNPLLRSLLSQGLITPDRFRQGLEVDAQGALLDSNGLSSDFLSTLGPPRKGNRFWETTAMPEIRAQAKSLALELLGRLEKPAI